MAPRVAVSSIEDIRAKCRVDPSGEGCWTWRGGCTLGDASPSMRIGLTGRTGSIGTVLNLLLGRDQDRPQWYSWCGNRLCCRPEPGHRWRASKSEQMAASQPTVPAPRRAAIARAKSVGSRVDSEAVRALRAGQMTTREAADRYSISVSYAWAIKTGKSRRYDTAVIARSVFDLAHSPLKVKIGGPRGRRDPG